MTSPVYGYPDWSRESHNGGTLIGSWTIGNGNSQFSPVFYCGAFPYIVVTMFHTSIGSNLVIYPAFDTQNGGGGQFTGGTQWFTGNNDSSMYFLTRGPYVAFNTQFWDTNFTGNITLYAYGLSTLPQATGIGGGIAPLINLTTTVVAANSQAIIHPNGPFSGIMQYAIGVTDANSHDFEFQAEGYGGTTFQRYQEIVMGTANNTYNGEAIAPNIPWRLVLNNTASSSATFFGLIMPKILFVG